jgi:hypothetical protein
MKYLRFTKLFLGIVLRDFHGAKVSIRAAFDVARLIHLPK